MVLKKNVFFIYAFTLIELIVAIVILSIFMMMAIPSLQAMIQNNRALSVTNDVVMMLNLARSEAITRGVSVSVCAASDSTLSACGTNWNNGWLLFTNPNEDTTFANNSTEILLKVEQITNPNLSITTTPSVGIVTYQPSGFPSPTTSNTAFNVSAVGCTGNNASQITISPMGKIMTIAIAC